MKTAEIIDLLTTATTDLYWSSESDEPFEIISWPQGTTMQPTALFGDSAPAVQIEMMTLTDLFAPVLTIEDWYEETELSQVNRYTDLLHAIESHLAEPQVFRIGAVEITIWIVGKTSDGDLVGLKTCAVET